MTLSASLQPAAIFSVSELNATVRSLIEDGLGTIWVEGEISNFAAPQSGHWYFSLKDHQAQVRCAMFKGQQKKLIFVPANGLQVLLKAKVSLYENRGEYQLIVEAMEDRGEGRLRLQFEILKQKLDQKGYFALERKRLLPRFPSQIGIITSATGAAIRDILTVLKRRFHCVPIIIYPSLVQGSEAAKNIVAAIETANRRKECDVLILARGGGSLEDLWPFNEEMVAEAIFNSQLPIISGIGHEVDITIADFVADVRAATPSAAAELVSPDCSELNRLIQQLEQRLIKCMMLRLERLLQQLTFIIKHLYQQHPKRRLLERVQQIDYAELALVQSVQQIISKYRQQLNKINILIMQYHPLQKIKLLEHKVHLISERFSQMVFQKIRLRQAALSEAAARLQALSPLATLQRGYSVVKKDGKVLTTSKVVTVGDQLSIQLAQGELGCIIKSIES